MFSKLFNSTSMIEKGLDATWKRNEVITNNIANVSTPGFKSSKVEFESVFKEALSGSGFKAKRTREGHLYTGTPDINDISANVSQNDNSSMRLDGNNVDIDFENAELAKNTIYYNTLTLKLNSEFSRIKMAIREGK
jgi:flagellar basal-body rod protein FlgB